MKKIFGIFGGGRKEGSETIQDFEDDVLDEEMHQIVVEAAPHKIEDAASRGPRQELEPNMLDELPDNVEVAFQTKSQDDVDDFGKSQAEFDEQTRAVTELGERHELIVARLGQIGEILQQLNDAQTLVDRLVKPLSATFRHHQAMTGQNIAMQNALDHINTEIVTLREREAAASARAGSLDLKLHHLFDSYTEVQDLHAAAEAELRAVSTDLRARDATLSDQERRMHELMVQIDELKDDLAEANMHWKEAVAAQSTLTQQLRQEQENYQALEQEHESLQTSVHHTVSEVAQLSRRLAGAEDVAMASREKTLQMEATLADLQAEKVRLLEQVNQLEQSISEERRGLAVKAEGMRGRSVTLEKLLTQTRDELRIQSDELRAALQKNTEFTISVERLETRCEKLAGDLHKAEEEHRHTDEARASLIERVDAMTKAIQAKDISLQRAKEVLEAQAKRLHEVEDKSSSQIDVYERRVASLAAALEQERTERALIEGTLEASRQEKLRLLKELAHYRTNRIDETPVEAPSTAQPLQLTAHIAELSRPVEVRRSEEVSAPVGAPEPTVRDPMSPVVKIIPSEMRETQSVEA